MVAASNSIKENTMTDNRDTPTKAVPNEPAFTAYHVRDRDGAKGFWTRIGRALVQTGGKSEPLSDEY